MQSFRVKTPMNKHGLIDIHIVTEIQDIINILKKYEPLSMVRSPKIMFHGSEEFLHLLQGSLLINGLDNKIWTPNMLKVTRGIHASSFCTYIEQLDY